jgi:hypothetical protein
MSFEFQKQKFQEGKDLRPPRSLTLTFAETNPWEMLVRDRLAALPRGYLKRVLLLLLEGSGMDLSNEAVFQEQVEKLLLTKNLAAALGSGGASRPFFAPTESTQIENLPSFKDVVQAAPATTQVPAQAVELPTEEISQRSLQASVTLPASKRQPQQSFKDGGFGALEL